MTIIKSYTDLEQSKKLAEILPLKSADMVLLHEEPYETSDSKFDGLHQALCVPFKKYDKSWRQKYKNISYFPCWSLAALLELIRSYESKISPVWIDLYMNGIACGKDEKTLISQSFNENSIVDCLYNIIMWLKEIGKL